MSFKNIITTLCAGAMLTIGSLNAYGWGQKGHDTVAAIAENHLTPTTAAAVADLLDGRSIVYWSNWMDNASHTPEYAFTKTWHYKNIDADETFRSARQNPDGDIVYAINTQYDVITNPSSTPEQKQLALKMLVHFLGDIHQPMHLGRASDRGGNNHFIKFFMSNANLHGVWDSRLVESGHKWSYSEWEEQLDRATPEQQAEIIAGACPEKWAEESYEIAKKIYAETPVNYNVEYDYIAKWTPVVEDRLLKGGLRLADLLNTALDPDYKGSYKPMPK